MMTHCMISVIECLDLSAMRAQTHPMYQMYANGEPAPRIEGLSPVHNVQEINVGRHDILSTDSARCSLSNKSVTPSLVFPLAALHHDALLLALR